MADHTRVPYGEIAKVEEYDDFDDYDDLEIGKAKPAYSKLVVATCLVLILAFTVTCLVFYWYTKAVDPVLIGFFFACFGVEFASLAFIKGREVRYVEGNPANKQMPHVELKEGEDD
ncbi:MAG: hypothetical protein IJ087_00290 [Eggerthellaceae bacterium]|nr:hypothetical protein [Eggerthellaceae bacterium]